MSLYRRSGSPFWWSQIYVGGGRVVRFSTGCRLRRDAQAKENRRVEEVEADEKRAASGHVALWLVGSRFLQAKDDQSLANGRGDPAETRKMRSKHLRLILAHFGRETDPRTITSEQAEGYKAARMAKVSAGTVCKELSTLRQLFKFAARAKLIPTAPEVHNPEHRYTGQAWHILTRDELARFLGALAARRSPEVYPWALLRANTGMRPSEASRLRWDAVNFRTCQVELPVLGTKGRRARLVDLNDGAIEALWLMAVQRGPGPAIGRVFQHDTHYGAWRAACEKAKVGRFRPHDLRHTLASYLHAGGTPLSVIRDILGHQSLDMVNRYAHTFSDQRSAALQAVAVRGVR
jgi:integrase